MKKTILSAFAASALIFTACGGGEKEGGDHGNDTAHKEEAHKATPVTYTVAEGATLTWTGYEVADKAGHHHIGTAPYSGTVEVTDGKVTGGSFDIDLTKLTYVSGVSHGATLTAEDTEMAPKLIEHIASADIFNTGEFANATYTISGYNADKDAVEGTLTVLGKEVAMDIPYSPNVSDETVEYTNTFDVDLSSAVPFFMIPPAEEGQEPLKEAPMKLEVKLNLKASK